MMKEIIDHNPDFLNSPRQKPTPEMVAAMAEENADVFREIYTATWVDRLYMQRAHWGRVDATE